MLNFKNLAFWLALLFLTVWSFTAYGQTLKPKINTFPPDEYEAHPQVFCSAKDSNGVLYFGTGDEILKYNGSEWKKIPVKPGFYVLSMDIDSKGRIWVGGTGDFGYLTPKNEANKKGIEDLHPQKEQQPGELQFVSLLDQVPDSMRNFKNIWNTHAVQGKVFFNTWEKYFFIYSKGGMETIKAKNGFFQSYILSSKALRTGNASKELWIEKTDTGIYRCKIKKGEKIDSSSLNFLPKTDFFKDKSVRSLISWQEHEALIGTRENGLYRYKLAPPTKGDTLKNRIIPFAENYRDQLQEANLNGAIRLNPKNNPYQAATAISTMLDGLWLFNKRGKPVLHLNKAMGMPTNQMWDCNLDKGGHLWWSTNKGIVQLAIASPFTMAMTDKELPGAVNDIAYYSYKKETLFIATSQGAYHVKSRRDGKPAAYHLLPGIKHDCNFLRGLGQTLFVGESLKGLLQINLSKEGWQSKQITKEHASAIALAPQSLTRRFNTSSLIAFGGRDGIFLLEQKEDEWKRKLAITELPKTVSYLAFKGKPHKDSIFLWASFQTNGLLRISLDTEFFSKPISEFESKTKSQFYALSNYDTTAGLPAGPIRTFSFKKKVGFGSDNGLYKVKKGSDLSDIHFVPDTSLGIPFTPESAGGQGKQVFRLKQVSNGNVWVQSIHPYQFIPDKDTYKVDSLPFKSIKDIGVRSFSSGSEKGFTWIGGDNGLVKYNSNVKKNFSRDYPCVISQVSIPKGKASGKDSALFHGKFYALDSSLHPPWKVVQSQPDWMIPTLHHDLNRLRFKFSAPYFEKQEAMKYSYKLAGFDNDWSRWKKETKKEYTNLPPGQYTFKVKAKNIYDHESQVGTYNVNVQAPFHRTIWFYGIQAGVLIIMGVLAGYLARTQKGRASKLAISLGTVVIFLVFEYCQNYVEVYFEDYLGGIVALKVALNVTVITLLIPFKTMMERLLLIQQDHLSEEGLKQKKVKEYKNMEWGSSNREEKL